MMFFRKTDQVIDLDSFPLVADCNPPVTAE
jgi:hypothetical protein